VEAGAPISWEVLEAGTPVRSRDGQDVGEVTHVLGDANVDIFEGVVIRGPHRSHRFVDATQIASIHERAVTLTIDAAAAAELPEPSENPPSLSVTPDDAAEGAGDELRRKLRRAWDLISGRY
jgi:hypothetical protein